MALNSRVMVLKECQKGKSTEGEKLNQEGSTTASGGLRGTA